MSVMSLALLGALNLSAPPPPPPPPADADAPASDDEGASEDAAPPGLEQPSEPGPAPGEYELDERYDPILPYGETPEDSGLQYADEPVDPAADLQYAEETPPDPALEYDDTRERPRPPDEAIERESDQRDDLGQREYRGRKESKQRFAVELKFGPYLPDVDRRYTGAGLGPYATVFGETNDLGVAIDQPKKAFFGVVGFEWQFFHVGGPLSIGTTIGFMRDSADALQVEPNEDGNVRNGADDASFLVVPVTLLLGYRFELLADRFRVPLVPYARGGIGYGFWRANKGGRGDISRTESGERAQGGSLGWQVNLGLMLRLDFIEQAAAVDLDRLIGINHTYLFGEWQFSRLDGFGSDKRMSVGDDTFTVGFAVEF